MTLRIRLLLTGIAVAVPLAAVYLLFDARQQLGAKREELQLSLELDRVNGLRQRCESNPPSAGRPGRGGSPEFSRRNAARQGRGPGGGPSGAFEYFAYDEQGHPSASDAPPLPSVRDGGPVGSFWSNLMTGPSVLVSLSDSGPCAFVLARIRPRPGERRAQVEALLLVMLSVVAAAWVAGGPLIARLRRLESATRRAAASQYSALIPVEGRDEVASVAEAFNDAASQARSLLAEVGRREQALREYVADTTHDVSIPLSVLQGHLAELETRHQPDSHDGAVIRAAMQEAHYMSSLLRNLATASKLQDGAESVAAVPVDLSALVTRVVTRHTPPARARGVALEYGVADPPICIDADPTLLEQALSNLVDNAVTYNHPGGHVAVVLDRGPSGFCLSVTDDGPGVPDQELSLLTDRWFRGSEARTRRPDGRGLGLAIAAESVKQLGLTLVFKVAEPNGLRAEIQPAR